MKNKTLTYAIFLYKSNTLIICKIMLQKQIYLKLVIKLSNLQKF